MSGSPPRRPSYLDRYKQFVRQHPQVVQNLDWLLYLTVWNPSRTSAGVGSSEVQYEAYHACIGLLSVWHQHLIEEDELPVKKPAAALWMEALEQVETIIELRAMHLESMGKMSRYAPLIALELIKSCLKMLMWSRYSGHLYLRHPSPEDIAHFEAEQGFHDVLSALERLRTRYTSLSECSAAATTDLMGQLSAAVQPLRAPMRWLGMGQASQSGGFEAKHTITSSRGDTSVASRGAVGCVASGHVQGSGSQHGMGAHEVCAGVQGSSIDWSQVPGLDEWGTVQGVAAWEVAAWQMSSSAAGGGRGKRLAGGVREGGGMAGRGSPDSAATSARSRRDTTAASSGQAGGSGKEQLQGPGVALHVFSDERAGMNLIWLGEMLHIWRPVIYVWLLYRYGRRSWRPWWISLAVDLLSSHFSRRGKLLLQRHASGTSSHGNAALHDSSPPTSLLSVALFRGLSSQQWSTGEVRELGDRRRKLAMYLLRSPFYNSFVKPPTESLQRRTAHMPLIGACTDYVAGLMDTFTTYYTYTSASS